MCLRQLVTAWSPEDKQLRGLIQQPALETVSPRQCRCEPSFASGLQGKRSFAECLLPRSQSGSEETSYKTELGPSLSGCVLLAFILCVFFLVDAASCTSQFCFIVLQHVCAHKHTRKRYLPAISLFSSKLEKVCSTANKGETVAHDTGKLERACFQMSHGVSLNPTVSPEDLYFMISIHPPCFLREFVLLI